MDAHAIRNLRRMLGWTQVRFSRELHVDVITVSRWERGHVAPSPMALALLRQLMQNVPKARDDAKEARK